MLACSRMPRGARPLARRPAGLSGVASAKPEASPPRSQRPRSCFQVKKQEAANDANNSNELRDAPIGLRPRFPWPGGASSFTAEIAETAKLFPGQEAGGRERREQQERASGCCATGSAWPRPAPTGPRAPLARRSASGTKAGASCLFRSPCHVDRPPPGPHSKTLLTPLLSDPRRACGPGKQAARTLGA